MCIGFNLALTEVKIFLPKLVLRYEFERATEEPIQYDPYFQPVRPMDLYVRAKKRAKWPEKMPGVGQEGSRCTVIEEHLCTKT